MFTTPTFLHGVERDRFACTIMVHILTIWISVLVVIPRSCAAEYGRRCDLRLDLSLCLQLRLR